MTRHAKIGSALALVVAGCAGAAPGDDEAFPRANLGGAGTALAAEDRMPLHVEQSTASKVLSAIAFERVTGIKAYPARLGGQ